MTDQQWLTTDDPASLLLHVWNRRSSRKFRLFAVACCRRISHPILSERAQAAIETAARHAEGKASDQDLEKVRSGVIEEWNTLGTVDGIWQGPEQDNPCEWVTDLDAEDAVLQASDWAAALIADNSDEWEARYQEERLAQTTILRDIMGNPFRPVTIDPAWLTPTVLAMAHAIHEEQTFTTLPILADALEDAGCDSSEILTHCRTSSPHILGCWLLDLLRGKT